MRHIILFASCLCVVLPSFAQKGKPKKSEPVVKEAPKTEKSDKWDITKLPHAGSTEITFSVESGTWMNLDVSPDGKEIVFDLLGDIYLLPIAGGEAKCIAAGPAWEVQPRFSPDGSKISFTSDRAGGDNIWYMNRDGSKPVQVTKESFRLLNNAVWSADGEYLIARKHFTGTRSLGAGEMWMYHLSGGSGVQLTKKRNDQMDAGEPCTSADGKSLFYSEDMSSGGYFQYNKDPNGQIYGINRYDLKSGKTEFVTGGAGGACRPQISPDGKTLAFIRRVRGNSVLYLRDMKSGEEWPLFDQLIKDQQETWAIFGVYPNFDWMPDGKSLVIYGKGKLHQVQVAEGKSQIIPFKAQVKQQIAAAAQAPQQAVADSFEVKMIRQATTSPDGKTLIFNAVGYLWKKELPNGKPVRLTNAKHFEYEPAFSADGNWLVYTTWSDAEMGAVRKFNLLTNTSQKLTTEKGFYFSPKFGNQDKEIVYKKGEGNEMLGFAWSTETGIYKMKSDGTEAKKISEEGDKPSLSADGKRLFYVIDPGLEKSFKVLDLETREVKTLATSRYAKDFTLSPDEKWMAFTELFQAYISALPASGQTLNLSTSDNVPVKKVSRDAGTSLHWSGDSKTLHWVLGPTYFSRELKNSFNFLPGAPDSLPAIDSVGTSIGLKLKTDISEDVVIYKNARIITMEGNEVIENGFIRTVGNKIAEIGKGEPTILGMLRVEDCKGKTIIPGFVDVHAHLWSSSNGINPQQQWGYYANLAYGVTTTHDPSNDTEMVFSQHEMVEAGIMVGPRIFSTGTILYGADGDFKAVVNSLDDARSHLRRMKAVGAFSVKSYNQPRRDQRQQILQAARELNMRVYPEGGSTFFHNMTQVMDGHTGIEHSIPVSDVYEDVIQFWSKTKVGYTPTLIVGYGNIWGENYWYDKTNVWENEKLLHFTPRAILDQRSRRRPKAPDEEYHHIRNSEVCKKLTDAGTKVNLGAHGQLQGMGVHWELWMLAQGGMSNAEALKAATLNGAEYIGMEKELGSLKTGKLADFVILDANPLEDIRNSEKIYQVVKNGRVYDAKTMDEVGGNSRKCAPFFWENSRANENFKWHEDTHSFEHGKCSCH